MIALVHPPGKIYPLEGLSARQINRSLIPVLGRENPENCYSYSFPLQLKRWSESCR